MGVGGRKEGMSGREEVGVGVRGYKILLKCSANTGVYIFVRLGGQKPGRERYYGD